MNYSLPCSSDLKNTSCGLPRTLSAFPVAVVSVLPSVSRQGLSVQLSGHGAVHQLSVGQPAMALPALAPAFIHPELHRGLHLPLVRKRLEG